VTAAGGEEGLGILGNTPEAFSLALVNLSMPRMDGGQVFREIRKFLPQLPVIICSGYSEYEIAKRFVDEPPTGFIQKPFQAHTLVEKILSALLAQK
jgi:two-component system, cell cycle sensor histidine kinase and response regulator CckA